MATNLKNIKTLSSDIDSFISWERKSFLSIKTELDTNNLLNSNIIEFKKKYKSELDRIAFLTELDIELCTTIYIYDEDLFKHCLETYFLIAEKMGRKLDLEINLTELFSEIGIDEVTFFRASLLHDIGKIFIPKLILNNDTNHTEMLAILRDLLKTNDHITVKNLKKHIKDKNFLSEEFDLLTILKQSKKRSSHIVPIKHLLNIEQSVIEKYQIDTNKSLMDIIETHEYYSEKILAEVGYLTESKLAGSHHNYHGLGSGFICKVERFELSFDIVELLRVADITQALSNVRNYKKDNFSKIKIWKIILEENKAGYISDFITYIWLKDELKYYQTKNSLENISNAESIKFIENELSKIYMNLKADHFV